MKAYQLQCCKNFPFDFERLESTKLEKITFTELSDLLDDCGLGRLDIDEYIYNWKFQITLIKKLND